MASCACSLLYARQPYDAEVIGTVCKDDVPAELFDALVKVR